MGYAISWLAVRSAESGAILSRLGMKSTGRKAECAEEPYTGRSLPNGWFLLVLDRCEHKFIAPESLAKLSTDSEIIACSIEEHVMVSTSELWRDGAKVWRIEHNAQESIDHLKEHGTLPSAYRQIKGSLMEEQEQAGGKQAETDYFFDIPLATAKSIVGFKHDEHSGLEDSSFEVFEGPRESKPWWKFW